MSRKITSARLPKVDIILAGEKLTTTVTAVIVDEHEPVDAKPAIMAEKSRKALNLIANHRNETSQSRTF